MLNLLKHYYRFIWNQAYSRNDKNIIDLLETNPQAKVLDIGCGDGQKTLKFQKKIGIEKIYGIDGVTERLVAAKNRGVETIQANLEKKWPFKDSTFDVLVSNQVIEHVVDLDNFISECHRILKHNGYCVISTENLSSWHNIFALITGHQDFSHHIIKKSHITNPFSPHYGEKTVSWSAKDNSGVDDTAFPHVKILTYKSLIKVFEIFGFKFEKGKASGYYPACSIISIILSILDPYHSHFITVKFRK